MGLIKKKLYNQYQIDFATIFSVLAHPGRIKIVLLLMIDDYLSLRSIQEKIGLCQSATSCQVKKLKDFGLLYSVEVGNSTHYYLNSAAWKDMRDIIQIFLDQLDSAEQQLNGKSGDLVV